MQNSFHSDNINPIKPPPYQFKILPVLEKLKSAYFFWYQNYSVLPKTHRYSLGKKIDKLFVDSIEAVIAASFLRATEKLSYIQMAMRKLDTLKVFLMLLWETKSLENKKYIVLSEKLNEIGRNLGGWLGQLNKQNSQK